MSEIKEILEAQHKYFYTGETKKLAFRIAMLKRLEEAVIRHEKELLLALQKDLAKAPFEGYETEVGIVRRELADTIAHLKQWDKPKRVGTPIVHFPSVSTIYREPYGSVLIMSPWNYPVQLTLIPLIGAIAAGNCAVVKPSEYAVHSAKVLAKLLREIFDEKYVAVLLGGRAVNEAVLKERFDYIFFTGSPAVGSVVMEAAAKHLTPVTLELGGKSPCIVDKTADIKRAARRIVWGKFLNAGQTCVAPDYVLVQEEVKEPLLRKMKHYIRKMYRDEPLLNPEYPKIINKKHFNRLKKMLLEQDGEIITGGRMDADTLKIEPTLLAGLTGRSKVMQEEIFGPVLPVFAYSDLAEVIRILQKKEKPLALYLFTRNSRVKKTVISKVSFGGGCINDTIIHLSNEKLPFGGAGNSGMGVYHGKHSYETFSREKSIMEKGNWLDIPFRYPPYGKRLPLLKKLLK